MSYDGVRAGFVPHEAAHWMIHTVLRQPLPSMYISNLIEPGSMGLFQLQLAELKKICVALKTIPTTKLSILKGFQGARKANIVQRIRHCLYDDYPACTIPNETVRQIASSPFQVQHPPHSSASRGHVPPNVASMSAQSHSGVPQDMPHHRRTAASLGYPSAEMVAFASAMRQSNESLRHANAASARMAAPVAAAATGQPNWPPQQPPWAVANGNENWNSPHRAVTFAMANDGSIPFFPHNAAVPVPSQSIRPPATYIKREGACQDPDSRPNSDAERSILGQLQQMSFDDPREILVSFRKIQEREGRPPSTDEVMIDIIVQREAAAEALQMDEARLLSEQTRKTDAAARRQQIQLELQVRMETCTVEAWHQNAQMFPQSWLLHDVAFTSLLQKHVTVTKTELKDSLVELLKMERDARKWYLEMPQRYFGGVAQRILGRGGANPYSDVATRVRHEIDSLTHVMYAMSEQVGGVPKAFRDALDAAAAGRTSNASDNSPSVDATTAMEEDDDVILVSSSPMEQPNKELLATGGAKTSGSSPTTPHEALIFDADIVDLCDDEVGAPRLMLF